MEISAFYYFLFFFLASFLLSKHLFPKTKNLPPSGPISLPIIGQLYLLKEPLHRTLASISAQYGPILLLKFGSRRILHVSSPSAVEECFTTNDVVFANRPHFLSGKYFAFDYTTLTTASYGQHWRNLRRLTTLEIFSSTRLQMFSKIRTNEVSLLLRRLFDGAGKASKIVEMKSLFFEVTLNGMMMMIAGKRYYGDDDHVDKARQFQELVEEMFAAAGASNVADFLPLLKWVYFNGVEKKLVRLQRRRDQFMLELIEEYRTARTHSKDEKTLIDVLLSQQEADPNYYTDDIIIGIIQCPISAGGAIAIKNNFLGQRKKNKINLFYICVCILSDRYYAGTMEWAMTLLSMPLRGQGGLINESDVANLPYLLCIINETLRMYPAGPLLIPHESSQECIVGGFSIPRGTMLLVNLWAIQNDPKLWEEPTKFKPERMEGMGGVRDGYKLMPFGSGRRSCPGEGLALRVASLTLASLIQCFEWERVDEELIDMTEGTGLTLPKAKPLEVKCKPRPTMLSILSHLI
ncbi:hypothetical protein NE237_031854 [Protea cynaroides]|uniref:Cytochrome P450 n=1 Tax=Protea cynaroides TaxID=273540 RepID=A0A9Q0L277_9MAGN|nr:hypothetical protein NE237_031854 [Protea cynaroides]